jgi:hypothetical protein
METMAKIIDADNTVKTICGYYCGCERDECGSDGPCEAVAFIEDAPTLSPDDLRPVGKWIDMGDFEQCSVCKGTHLKEFNSMYGKTTWVKTPYCHNCGAKMKGE